MAANIVSNINEFDSSKEQFANYKRRLESWMRLNTIPDAIKLDAFIAVVGAEAVDLLVALCAPDAMEDKTYTQLCDLLEGHYTSGTKGRTI